MSEPSLFENVPEETISALLRQNPLAWIFCDGEPMATAAPVQLVEMDGALCLVGHLPRRFPLFNRFAKGAAATFLFTGPHGYMSPSWLADRTQGPTWNFTSVQYRAQVEIVEDDAFLNNHLDMLCAAMEEGRPNAWAPVEMGDRLATLAKHIAAFKGRIIDRSVKFKLGQDERDDVYADILDGMEKEPRDDVRDWMKICNPGRS